MTGYVDDSGGMVGLAVNPVVVTGLVADSPAVLGPAVLIKVVIGPVTERKLEVAVGASIGLVTLKDRLLSVSKKSSASREFVGRSVVR